MTTESQDEPTAPVVHIDSGFRFGKTSEQRLQGVHPTLVQLARVALHRSKVDFAIMCGVRALEDQAASVKRGTSKTMKSNHLIQADGYSHAIDAVPWVDGKPSWDWLDSYTVAQAFHESATELGIADKIRWGGVWDRSLAQLGDTHRSFEECCAQYCDRHVGADFLDGPHYELIS